MRDAKSLLGPSRSFLEILAASSIIAGCVNLSSSLLQSVDQPSCFSTFLLLLSASISLIFTAELIISMLAGLVFQSARPRSISFAVSLGVLVIVLSGLWPAWKTSVDDLAPASRFIIGVALLVLALISYALGFLFTHSWQAARMDRPPARVFLLAAPSIALASVLFLWVHIYTIQGLVSFMSLLALVTYCFLVASLVILSVELARHIAPLLVLLPPVLVSAAAVFIATLAFKLPAADLPSLEPAGRQRSSLILLTVDTLRADSLSILAGAPPPTPAIDALFNDSVVFLNARSPASWTKPAFASILSGLSPLIHQTTARESLLPSQITTLAEHLREAGYHTAAIGRNPFLTRAFNFHQGFSIYQFFPLPSLGDSSGAALLRLLCPHRYSRKEPTTDELTELAIEWLRSNRRRPFFLWLHYFDPHIPYAPPRRYLTPEHIGSKIGDSFNALTATRSGHLVLSRHDRQRIRSLYDSEVRYVDDNVERVLTALKELDLYDPSLIVFTSDHGEEFWEHGGFEHGHTMYDELLRVPLAFKLPTSHPAAQLSFPVSIESVTPTILDVLGIQPAEEHFSADSLLPSSGNGGSDFTTTPIIAFGSLYYEESVSVVFDSAKYIYDPSTGLEQLYDLHLDPQERNSLASRSPDLLNHARSILNSYQVIAKEVRNAMNLPDESDKPLTRDVMDELRALGYVD